MADKTLFSLDDVLSHITGKAKQAAAELKEVRTLLTQIQKAGNPLSTSAPDLMMNNAFDTAGKYGKSVTAYLSSVLEASRMGLENAEGFAELSLALQSACDISADLAGQYLLAADQAFAMNGSTKELTATLDGACSLADRHALSMTALAEGMSAASTQAAASGMDIRETTAALATLLATTDLSGTEAGNALAGLLMYLQQITGELNGAASLAGPMQLLKELSEAHTALNGTDTKRTTLFDAVNDTPFQSEALDALLQNYGLYEEMLQDYADGTGTLAANATKAADTWEGSLNRLSNKWTDTIEKLTDSKSIAAAIDHLSGLLAVIDSLTDTLGSLNTLSLLGGGLLGAKNLGLAQYTEKGQGLLGSGVELGGLFNKMKVDTSSYKNVIDDFKAISNFSIYLEGNNFDWDSIAASLEHCDERALSYFKTLDNGNGTINTQSASMTGLTNHLEKTGQSYSFAAVKATLLNTALNAGVMFLASFAIQAIVKGLDQYIHRAQRAREAAEQAQQAIDESQSSLKKTTSTLSDTKDRFLELSEGVSRFSQNLSLSEKDYAEYLSISNQLAELFPSLIADYDEQGNALLLIGNNADETREKLQNLLETQQAVAQQTLIDNMDSVATGVYYDAAEAKGIIASLENDLANLQAKRKNLDIDLKSSHNQVTIYDADYEKYGTAMEKALTSAGITFDVERPVGETNTFIRIDPAATSQQLESAQKFYDAQMDTENEFLKARENKLKADIQTQENNIKTAYSKMNANIQAWMKDNYIYQYLPDSMADLADALVPEIEWEKLNLPLSSGIDYQNYIDKYILTPLLSIPTESREQISSMFRTLLSFEDGDLDILPFAETLQAALKELGISIDITPIIADEQDAKAKLTNSLENIAQGSDYYTASGNRVDSKQLNELTEYTKDFNAEQIESWAKVTLGCNNAAEAIEKYEEALKSAESAKTFTPSLSASVNQLAAQLEPQFTKLGEAYRSVFTSEGFTRNAINNPMLEGLIKSFTELGEETGVAFDTSKLETFLDILTDADSTSSQVQQAFNNLATAYLYSTDTLKYLNEETADAVEKQLEEMGVANASELVYNTLNAKLEALTLQKQLLAAETEAAANKTTFSVSEFLKEAGASEAARACLFSLTAAEQIFGNTDLSTEEKVKELKELAAAYGQTAIVTRIANMEKAAQDGHIPIDYDKELAALQDEINHAVSNIPINFNTAEGVSSAGSAGSAAGDAYVDAFEEELKSLEDLKSNGIISEKQYLDRLRSLYEHYFKDKRQYAEQYAKYEHEYLNGYKSLYEALFSHAASLIGDRITLLQDEKDTALDSLEAQKKAAEDSYKAQIRLLEDKKSVLQDEIDKIRAANEDRKEALNLQEKERNLARAENQRTVLQYSEERGFYYEADAEAIQEARTALEDARADAQVRALEKQQEALDKQIEALQEMADASNEYWEAQKEQTEQYYNTLVSHMEDYKSRWEGLSGIQEKAEMNALLKEFGYSEADLLKEGSGALEGLSLSYLGILKDLNAGNQAFLDSLSQLTGADLGRLPGFLEQTRQSLDSLTDIDTAALSDGLKGMGDSFSTIAASAADAAAAISGNGTAQAEGGQAQPPEGSPGNPAAAGGQTSLKAALEDLSTESVDSINKISDAFAGEDSEGTSVTGAIKKVTDRLGSTDPDKAGPDSLMAVLNEQTALALDEENGIPAQKQAWEQLNEPLGQAAEAVTTIKDTLTDMDGKTFSVTLNVLGSGGTLTDSLTGDYGTPGAAGQAQQPVPFPREDDHSKSAEMYRRFTAAMEDSAKRTDFITAAPKLNPVSRFTDLTGPNNYNNVTNRNINENPVINQEFHITMPNVTNSTSAQALLADLQSIGHKKYQFFNTIKKV